MAENTPPVDLIEYLFPGDMPETMSMRDTLRDRLRADPPVSVDYFPGTVAVRLQSGLTLPILANQELPPTDQAGLRHVELTNSQHMGGAGRTVGTPAFGITGT